MHRTLDSAPVTSLAEYVDRGGGRGLDAAREVEPDLVIDVIAESGLRGRGGAGFPTHVKWTAAAARQVSALPPSVVVNGAEGEPGSFKDRTLLRTNPYKVLEGALVAAHAVGADRVVVAVKATFRPERLALARAITELREGGWLEALRVELLTGPDEYLFGEETGLLEVAEGRWPFPRVTPPYRRGAEDEPTYSADSLADGGSALVNNVETLANVAGILAEGPDWFRAEGTDATPGTIVCTVTGDTAHHGVLEMPAGTPVAEIIERAGGGARPDRRLVAALAGVSNPFLPQELFDTPACYDALRAVGSGLGTAGWIVLDDTTDLVGAAEGVARFLSVESCGQCEPCKSDGLAVAAELGELRAGRPHRDVFERLLGHLDTITDGARCYLATQQELVARSLLDLFPRSIESVPADGAAPVLIAPMKDLVDGRAVLDDSQAAKNPDWTHRAADSGKWPAARLGGTPVRVGIHAGGPLTAADAPRPAAAAAGGPASGPVVPIDVADQLAEDHGDLVELLLCVGGAPPDTEARTQAVDAFEARLTDHVEATGRVLFPMVRRVAGGDGEAAADRAEGLEEAAAGLAAELRRDGGTARSLTELVEDLERLVLEEERRVVPLLRHGLDDDAWRDLGLALQEVRAGDEPVAAAP